MPRCWTNSSPSTRHLLARRDELQLDIDDWHRARRGQPFDVAAHEAQLAERRLPGSRRAGLSHRHAERRCRNRAARGSAASRAAQQRALCAQCRQCPLGQSLRCVLRHRCHRGNRRARARRGLQRGPRSRSDRTRARGAGSGRAARRRAVTGTRPATRCRVARCVVALRDGARPRSRRPAQFKGYLGSGGVARLRLLFEHHGLHIEVRIDHAHPIGRDDTAGIADVQLESALTTIMDLEDSIAAVDSADKVAVYRNWLGLMRGDLTARFAKGSGHVDRKLNADRSYQSPAGGDVHDSRPQPDADSQRRALDDDGSHPAPGPGSAGRHRRCRQSLP